MASSLHFIPAATDRQSYGTCSVQQAEDKVYQLVHAGAYPSREKSCYQLLVIRLGFYKEVFYMDGEEHAHYRVGRDVRRAGYLGLW